MAPQPLQKIGHDDRRQAERRLVEQQQARPVHQRARQRQHLLLAARQQPGPRLGPFAEHGEERQHLLDALAALRAPAAHDDASRFSRTVRPAKTRRPSGT